MNKEQKVIQNVESPRRKKIVDNKKRKEQKQERGKGKKKKPNA